MLRAETSSAELDRGLVYAVIGGRYADGQAAISKRVNSIFKANDRQD